MSLASLLLGALLFLNWDRVRGAMGKLDWLYDRGPEAGYFKVMDGLVWTADWQTRVLQNGYLRNYILTIVLTTVGLVGYALFSRYDVSMVAFGEIRLHEYAVAGLLVASALFACLTHSRLGAVASAGVFGFAIALIFILFSAPDLGITQILVETLTVILLILVLFRLPGFINFSSPGARLRDAAVALSLGGLITLLILATVEHQFHPPISEWLIERSVPEAYGRNIVNVILVDYRALDTLGEIFVLGLAAIGVYAMIKFKAEDRVKDERSADMGHSLILQTAARFLLPLQLLFSIFLLLRGHDEPGGGFIAGLVAAGALRSTCSPSASRPPSSCCGSHPRICSAGGCSSAPWPRCRRCSWGSRYSPPCGGTCRCR